MNLTRAVETVRRARRPGDIVITTMGTAREWIALCVPQPLDLVFVPSAMGHAPSVGLGLALARPDLRVIVCNGDGSMLMNLGSLVTIAAANAQNLTIVVFDNGVYEVTTGNDPQARSSEATVRTLSSSMWRRCSANPDQNHRAMRRNARRRSCVRLAPDSPLDVNSSRTIRLTA